MSPHAVLGPIDPQLGRFPAASLLKVLARKPIAEVDEETVVLADLSEKALRQLHETAKWLLQRTQTPDKATELANLLTTGAWTHDYPISADEARRLGLRVNTDIPKDMLHLMGLYPQPTRRQPSVEYLPGRRRTEHPEEATQPSRRQHA